jgi:hypothetical protein
MNAIKLARICLALLLSSLGVLALTPSSAQAHAVTAYFTDGRWPTNASISYGINVGFPAGAWRSRMYDGKQQWNNATSTGEPSVFWTLPNDVSYGSAQSPCGISGINKGAIFWNDLDYLGVSVLAATRLCSSGSGGGDVSAGPGTIYNFTIEVDSSRTNWYTGTGDNPDKSDDLWSVASHEFGHVLGFWEHFSSTDPICVNDSSQNTMCPTHFPGTERMRTLGSHDIHTFDAAYL